MRLLHRLRHKRRPPLRKRPHHRRHKKRSVRSHMPPHTVPHRLQAQAGQSTVRQAPAVRTTAAQRSTRAKNPPKRRRRQRRIGNRTPRQPPLKKSHVDLPHMPLRTSSIRIFTVCLMNASITSGVTSFLSMEKSWLIKNRTSDIHLESLR